MPLRKPFAIGLLALAWVAGCGSRDGAPSSGEPTARSSSAIQGGTTDATHGFAVGVVQFAPSGAIAFCSGVLLAPNLVATARHCVSQVASAQIDCATSTFSSTLPARDIFVTPDATIVKNSTFIQVISGDGGDDGILVPTGSSVCGNDIALLILAQSIQLPQYVTPSINPPMTDHQAYTTSVTAIGYGVNTPTDTRGTSAGIRRIKKNIGLVCIPNDATPADCFPRLRQIMEASEFEGGDGTCEGDSGSGAFDQGNFDKGNWVSFGVLSRGGVTPEGGTCVGSIYSRFDAWPQLLAQAAQRAATAGGYSLPSWAPPWQPPSGASSSEAGTTPACLQNRLACSQDTDCCSVNCISHDDGGTAFCSVCDANNPCNTNYGCQRGVCVLGVMSAVGGGLRAGAACSLGSPPAPGGPIQGPPLPGCVGRRGARRTRAEAASPRSAEAPQLSGFRHVSTKLR